MRSLAALLMVAALVSCLEAQVIDFETLPGGAPSDGLLIRDQFNVAPFWVTFELVGRDSLAGPFLARVGPDLSAFVGPEVYNSCSGESSPWDKPALGEDVGCYFLTDDGLVNLNIDTLRICYTQPVRQASGELLDIDGAETWTVRALAADGQTVLSTLVFDRDTPGTGDGIATLWAFDLGEDIHYIDIWGQKPDGFEVGIAFDNFSPVSTAADLSVSKVGPEGPVEPGDTLQYMVTIENLGPGIAQNVEMTDRLPEGLEFLAASPSGLCACASGLVECNLGTIGVGESVLVEITGVLSEIAITNDVSVSASEYDPSPANNSAYWGSSVNCAFTGVDPETEGVRILGLEQNRPNPFNPATTIGFSTFAHAHVRLRIVDASGRVVRRLVDAELDAGEHRVVWDGLNEIGRPVASGVYFYQLESNGRSVERKMVLIE